MIVSRGLGEPDVMEQFRSDEIGDIDRDGAPEFIDGWGNPIIFLRWAPGFSDQSQIQESDSTTKHDPFDPLRVDQPGYALIPLIASGGPDGLTRLQITSNGWSPLLLQSIVMVGAQIGAPVSLTSTDHLDNVTNHDLLAK
jgi:hypothetical protein